jgi:hypothetical protein
MRDRLRVRRLRLAPAARPESDKTVDPLAISEADHFLAMEQLERVSAVVQAAMTRPGPHIHAWKGGPQGIPVLGIGDRIGV